MYLDTLTMYDLQRKIKETPIIIVPFGSVEEHGPYLPLSTDTIQMMEILKIVENKTGVCVAPPIHYGVCRSTEQHPGTISISAGTLRCLVDDLLEALHRQGFKAAILISGHAGKLHQLAMIEAGEKFINGHTGMRVFVYSELDLMGSEIYKFIETHGDSHAGEIETSRMLYIDEKLVKKGYQKAKKDFPRFFPGEIVRDKMRYWKSGIWGDPSKADKEKGRQTLKLSADRLIAIIRKISD